MKNNKYRIVDSFCLKGYQVLTLDRDFDSITTSSVLVDGKRYNYALNSVKRWVIIHTENRIQNKDIEFVA